MNAIPIINQQLDKELELCQSKLDRLKSVVRNCSELNAHELRAPLARIMGLINLVKLGVSENEYASIIDQLKSSADELNIALRHINVLLEDCLCDE